MSNNSITNEENERPTAPLQIKQEHYYGIERDYIQLTLGGIYRNRTDGEEYQLIEYLTDLSQAVFKHLATSQNKVMNIHDFKNVTDKSNVSVKVDLDKIGDDAWQQAQERYLAIKPIVSGSLSEYAGERGYERRSKEVGVSSRTLKRWVKAYESTGSIGSLIQKKKGPPTGGTRLDVSQENVIREVINDYYLSIQRPSVESTVREVTKRCHLRNITKPSKNTIRRRIASLSEKDVLRGRGQRRQAKQKFTPKAGKFPGADVPLSVIQIDHTPVDLIIVDDKYRKPIGRPFITLAIDVYSRMITGYYIALDSPSVTSVGMCISRSILPKDELLREFKIEEATWDVFGIPRKIHVDNGSDFRANSLQKSCAFHGIDLEFRPLARPEFGGHIERLIGTVMKQVHELPGTTFSNIKQKDTYDSEKHAALTLHEFETWFLTYLTKVYHNTPHNGIGRTPNEQWRIGLFGDGHEDGIGIPPIPANANTLTLDFMPSVERTIQRNGVTIEKLTYYDPCLNTHINETDHTGEKKKFTFRQDPRDISSIWFYDPILQTYFNVPLANGAFPAMSMWEYRQLRKQVKAESGTVNEALICEAWNEMQSLIKEGVSNTKTLRRREQRQRAHTKSQSIHKTAKVAASENKDNIESASLPISEVSDDWDDDDDYFEDIH